MLFGFALGSPGVLTFAANVIPDRLVAIQTAWETGDHEEASAIWLEWLPMFKIIHIEPVPNVVVYMLNRMGWNFGTQRVPAHEPSEKHKQKIDGVLRSMGLIGQQGIWLAPMGWPQLAMKRRLKQRRVVSI